MKEESTEYFDRDALSLQDMARVLINQRKWLFGVPILCIILAAVGVFLAKPKWEATAVIQIGQISATSATLSPQLIEPSARTVERMKMKSFEDDVLAALKIPVDPGNSIANLFRNGLTVKSLGTTDLVQVRVRAHSREQAALWATTVVDRIIFIHKKLTQPTVARLGKQLIELNKQVGTIGEERDSLSKIVLTIATRSGDGNFSQNLLLSDLLMKKNADLREVEMRRLGVEEQITSIQAFPTTLADRVFVPDKPVSPDKVLILVLATMGGLILGIILSFARNYWQSAVGRV